ncbi:hypothetical protein [Saccharopolyspora sp. NPDC050642]|uniref:hypothetical protein n=1 Tax=Saccharopolyspora sp. NPDC050642 TaxID=3157099 RepID=UPI003409E533
MTAALSVPPESHQAALDLQQQRREAQLDELARRQAAATMRFLRQECFDNPASARLFLMLNASSRLGVFPNADQAEDVVTEVNKWHPDTLWVQVARTLQTALASLTPGQTDELLRLLSVMLRTTGHPSQADELNDLRSPATDSAEANGHSFGATQPH